jgi:transposase
VSYTAGEVDYLLHRLGWSWQAPAAVDALPSQPLYWGRQASHKSLPASAATL